MKAIFSTAMVLAASVFVNAQTAMADEKPTFAGEAIYMISIGSPSAFNSKFSALEMRGVERSAELDAIFNCQNAGNMKCAVINVTLVNCNYKVPPKDIFDSSKIACHAEAIAIAL